MGTTNNADHDDLLRQVPNTHKTLRIKIMHNIGILFVKMGQYNDACSSFEWIMSEQVRRVHNLHINCWLLFLVNI